MSSNPIESPKPSYLLGEVSLPPKRFELENLVASKIENIPKKYTRNLEDRIFVNRNVRMDAIEYFGFDMDYTLADYLPEYEGLQYDMVLRNLIKAGYPEALSTLKYNPSFPLRGLCLDTKLGNLLKIDYFGYILSVVHGHKKLSKKEILEIYPDKEVHTELIGTRYYLFDALFGLPEEVLYCDLVDFLENKLNLQTETIELIQGDDENPNTGHPKLSYVNLFQDMRNMFDKIHNDGTLKGWLVKDLSKYIRKDSRLPVLLKRLREQGRKVFLLTNSDFWYTNHVLSFLLDPDWRFYFDICIVSARKPAFFGSGSSFREVNIETGQLQFTSMEGSFIHGKVYCGGNFETFKKLTGTSGGETIYIGDNIYHDIIRTKKNRCLWKTCLVVREISHEVNAWRKCRHLYTKLMNLEYIRAETYRSMDSSTVSPPDSTTLTEHITKCVAEMDREFNPMFGSLFRSGSHASFFSMQVQRFADLYTSDFLNMLNYPFFYYFNAFPRLLPHELIEHYDTLETK